MNGSEPAASKVVFLLHHAPGIGRTGLATLLYRLQRENISPDKLLSFSDDVLLGRFKLKRETIEAIQRPAQEVQKTWEQIETSGIGIVTIGLSSYPSGLTAKLGQTSPPILYLRGNRELLFKKSVGFCGSRKASDKGLFVAASCAR